MRKFVAWAARMLADSELAHTGTPQLEPAGTLTDVAIAVDVGSGGSGGGDEGSGVKWTALVVVQVAALFLVAGLAEIGGGWLVWQSVRESKPWWWALAGSGVSAEGFDPPAERTPIWSQVIRQHSTA